MGGYAAPAMDGPSKEPVCSTVANLDKFDLVVVVGGVSAWEDAPDAFGRKDSLPIPDKARLPLLAVAA